MKLRLDFVTNSSSSSFLICKKSLTNDQIDAIRVHDEIAERMGLYCADEAWSIYENDTFIAGYTYMDNFSMSDFLELIGISDSAVEWGEHRFDLSEDEYEEQEVSNNRWKEILENIRNGE